MRRAYTSVLVALAIILAGALLSGCSGGQPGNKYVAIYEERHDVGTLAESGVPIVKIPVPQPLMPFDYDGSQGLLPNYPGIDKNMKILYGSWKFLDNPGTISHTESIKGIAGFPYTLDSGLVITGIDANGTVSASYKDSQVTLKIGDTWHSPVTTRAETDSFMVYVNGNWSDVYQPFLVYYNMSWTVENKGVFDKSNLDKK